MSKRSRPTSDRLRALKPAAWFLVFGLLWIWCSDLVVSWWVAPEEAGSWQTLKGFTFVGLVTLLGWWLILRAIRREHHLARSVEQSEARLRGLFDQVLDGIALINSSTRRAVLLSARFRQRPDSAVLLEGTLEDWLARCADEQRDAFLVAFARVPSAGSVVFEFEYVDGPGATSELLEIRLNNVAVPGNGDVLMIVRSLEPERRQRERQRRTAVVYESMRDGVMITDTQPAVVAVNPAFKRITGYTDADVLGRNPSVLQSGEQDEHFYAQLWQSLAQHGRWEGELWNRRKNGEYYPERLAINVVRNDAGDPVNYVAVFTDLSDVYHSRQRLERATYYDELTALPNRALLTRELQERIDSPQQDDPIALLLVDLDDFRRVNDSLGYQQGDQLLQQLAKRLEASKGNGRRLARLEGDEFALVVYGEHEIDVVERIADSVNELLAEPFELADQHRVYVRASLGASRYPVDADSVERLFQHADAALADAKGTGKNRLRLYDHSMKARAAHWLSTETRLREALNNEEFRLVYQPLVSARENEQLIGAEALLRWHPAGNDPVSPVDFIDVAESSGVIVPLGLWVLESACQQLVAWRGELPALKLSVNVSARQLEDERFVEHVEAVLQRTGLAPARLELELTESLLVTETGIIRERLNQLKQLGLNLAVDDFGTGYSSLAYLQRLPIDKLKIDRCFVDGVESDHGDRVIAETIIAMGRTLSLEVLAEGVETVGQRDRLRAMGCDAFQGYYFARPLAPDALLDWARHRARTDSPQ